MLDIDLLKTFLAIIETGSFTAAADVVGRTQSAVSLQMKRLEEQVGHALLLREPGRVAPTPQGELLVSHARTILRAQQAALSALGPARVARELHIGISADYGQRLLPRVLAELDAAYPSLTVVVECGPASNLAQWVQEGRLEVAFLDEGEGLDRGPVVHREKLVWAGVADIHLRDPLPLAMVPRECLYRRWATDRLDAAGRRYRIAYTSYSIGGIQAIVRGGFAVTAISEGALVPPMRVLTEAEGFPALPPVEVRIERSQARDSAFLREVEALLVAKLTQAEATAEPV